MNLENTITIDLDDLKELLGQPQEEPQVEANLEPEPQESPEHKEWARKKKELIESFNLNESDESAKLIIQETIGIEPPFYAE